MRPPTPNGPYDAVVFAGGGCRCFWQAGFWTEAAPALELAPRQVAGVSAGSAFACASSRAGAASVQNPACQKQRQPPPAKTTAS